MPDQTPTETGSCQPSPQEVDTSTAPDLSRQFAQEAYGSNYKDHLLEQYKLFVEMADRVSQRRAQANAFYITVLAGIVGILTFLGDKMSFNDIPFGILLLVGFLGTILCLAWGANIYTHKQLNSGKFKVIH